MASGSFRPVDRAVDICNVIERRSYSMKQEQKAYEAPKAIIVDFDNDYVLAAPNSPGFGGGGGNSPVAHII